MTYEQQTYIANMLRHSSYKKYENYVISQIFWKLYYTKNILLKLITQQTIFREDSKNHVAYLDAYFPAINVAIEVDEKQHKYTKIADKKREDDIMLVLGALNFKEKPIVLRVDASSDNVDLNSQIDRYVEVIAKRYEKCEKPIWKDIDNIEYIKKQGYIKTDDNLIFKHKNELVNILGIRTHNGSEFTKHGTQNISLVKNLDENTFWFPCISDNVESGWLNSYDVKSGLFKTQYVKHFKKNYFWQDEEKKFKLGELKDRYFFFKVKDQFNNKGYKYFGKFKCILYDAQNQKSSWQHISDDNLPIF